MLQSAEVNGATLTLTYDEALDGNSIPQAGVFMVNVNSTPAMVSRSASSLGSRVRSTYSESHFSGTRMADP